MDSNFEPKYTVITKEVVNQFLKDLFYSKLEDKTITIIGDEKLIAQLKEAIKNNG